MFKKISLIVLLALAPMAMADDIVYSWTHATTRTDGSAITGERSYVLDVNGTAYTATGETFTVTGLKSGKYDARIATIEAGRQGPWSPVISTTIDAPPSAPGSLRGVVITVTIEVGQ